MAVIFATWNLIQLRRVNKTLPVLLNIVVDLIVAYVILWSVGQGWDSSIRCSERYGEKLPKDVLRHCLAVLQVVVPVVWSFIILSGIVG